MVAVTVTSGINLKYGTLQVSAAWAELEATTRKQSAVIFFEHRPPESGVVSEK
jgi:hypothetical protein